MCLLPIKLIRCYGFELVSFICTFNRYLVISNWISLFGQSFVWMRTIFFAPLLKVLRIDVNFFSSLLCIFHWNSADILRLVSFGVEEEEGGRFDLMKFHEWAQFSIKFIASMRCPKCVPFFIRSILSEQAYSYSHNILRLVNAKEHRAAWYKICAESNDFFWNRLHFTTCKTF